VVVHGDVAYFGGFFRRHDGVEQRSLGAVLVSTGRVVPAFDPQTDGRVLGLALDGDRLVVAGRFTSLDGAPRAALAAVSLPDGTLEPWTPPAACDACNTHWDVLAAPGVVYTATRNAGAVSAFDSVTGSRRWRVTANGDAQALALADGLLYVGGHFAQIGSPRQPRRILAALDATTGRIDPDFQPRFVDSYPGIWALHASDDVLYVGGHFIGAGEDRPRRYPYFAMFD
jgi:outer membrane protein assembly factor BamB